MYYWIFLYPICIVRNFIKYYLEKRIKYSHQSSASVKKKLISEGHKCIRIIQSYPLEFEYCGHAPCSHKLDDFILI